MSVKSRITSFVRNLLSRNRVEQDLDDELRAYVQLVIEEKRSAGPIRTMLFGVSATDGATYLGVALVLGAVVLVATYIPARRAMQIDPMVALRNE